MKNKSILLKSIIFIAYLNFLVMEVALPYIGIETGLNVSLLIFIFAIRYNFISGIFNAYIYGFVYDSAYQYGPFGIFSLLSLVYFTILSYFKNKSAIEFVAFFIYVINYCLTSVFFVGFTFSGLFYSFVSYIMARILFILFFKL